MILIEHPPTKKKKASRLNGTIMEIKISFKRKYVNVRGTYVTLFENAARLLPPQNL
jgi:hypothetical protein